MIETATPEIERQLLIDAVRLRYGYDFRGYAAASFDRRIKAVLAKYGLPDIMELLVRLMRTPDFFQMILPDLTVGTTEMFRDPGFFKSLRENVVPTLQTYPSLNVWIAGCSGGQEAYSIAILLKEAGLYERSVIFATDINPQALHQAKEGIFPADALKTYTRNYIEAGGKESFSKYYVADYGFARMDSSLKDNMVFSPHNLLVDQVFTEANLILCRNVLIYFDKETQNQALELMRDSLGYRGFLAIGSKENLKFSSIHNDFEVIDGKNRIYQKQGTPV